MKRLGILIIVALLLTGCLGKPNDEAAIVNLLNQLASAMETKNISKMVSLCADEVTIVDSDMVLTKDELGPYLALGLIFIVEFNRYELNNFNIIITGQSAVIEATLTVDAETIFGNQQESVSVVYEARKIAGSWKITAF